jgi:hypothetical protein
LNGRALQRAVSDFIKSKKSIYYFYPGNKSKRKRNPSVKISKKMLAAAMFLRKVQLVALGLIETNQKIWLSQLSHWNLDHHYRIHVPRLQLGMDGYISLCSSISFSQARPIE